MIRKKLLYVGNALSHKGRTATHIDTLSALLREEQYEVRTTSSYLNKGARFVDMIFTFLRYCKKVDYVLIDTYSTTNFWYAVAIARLCRHYKLPYIPILHGGNLPERLEIHKRTSKGLFGNALLNVVPSAYLYNAFAKAGYSNLKQIPNSIELEKYPFKQRKNLAPKLLWVRAFANIYNPQMALEVLKELLKVFPDAKLTMVGPEKDGSLKMCVEKATKEKLPVIFTGKLSQAQWIVLSKESDIFINTTNFDNTPVSVIEAMALGLPIISTDVGGLAFLIEDGIDGILTPKEDVILFYEKLIDLLKNQNFAESLSTNGRSKSQQFDWSRVKILWHEVLS